MSQETQKREAYTPDQVSDRYDDLDSQLGSSQADFVQQLPDSQETNTNVITDHVSLEKPSKNVSSTGNIEVNYFTRPAIETTEEIGAIFQFHKAPPPRAISHGLGLQQQNNPALPPVANGASQCGVNSILSGLTSQNKPAIYQQAENREEATEYSDDCQRGNITSPIAHFQKSPQNAPGNNKPPSVESPSAISTKNTSGFPFPEDAGRKRHGGKTQKSRGSLAKTQLPKAISDTRRKALAQISPHNSFSRQGAVVSPTANSPSAKAIATDREVRHGTKRRSESHGQPKDSQLSQENGHNEDKRISTNGSLNKRHKIQSLTRPISLEPSEYEPFSARPCSQTSISSKLRSLPRANHKRHTPTREQNGINLMKFAESWNTNYLYNQRLLDRWEDKMLALENHITSQNSIIAQLEETLKCRDQQINDLSAKVEHLDTQNQEAQSKINTSDNMRKKLEDKLRTYKTRLNDAIGEQQRLFVQSREICQKATTEIKEDERMQKESIEKAFTALERLRTKITQEMAAVAKDSNGKVDELNKAIKSLENELRDREKELECERQHTQGLTEQLSQLQRINECSLQSASVQNQEFLDQMKQDHMHAKNVAARIRKQEEKIDMVLKTLEQMSSKTLDPIVVMEKLREVHSSMATTIITEFQNSVASTQNSILGDQEALNESIGEIHLLCKGICEKLDEINDVEAWQEKAHNSEMAIRDHMERTQNLQNEVNQLCARINEQKGRHEELERQLATATVDEKVMNEKIQTLKEQTKRFQEELNGKELILSEAERNLQVTQEELERQIRVAQDREKEIESERQSHKKAIELSVQRHKQDLSQAAAEKAKELREKNETAEKQLEEIELARAQLEEELAKSRQEVEVVKDSLDRDMHQVRGEVSMATASIAKIALGLERAAGEEEALRGSLELWSRDRVEMDQMKHILRRLASDQPNAIQMSDQLKHLLRIHKSLRSTLEYHQAEATAAEAENRSQSRSMNVKHGLMLKDNQRDDMAYAQEKSQEIKRKVMVKSPVDADNHRSPMSVEQERSTRRHATPLRGIMKVTSSDVSVEIEGDNTQDMNSQMLAAPQLPLKRKVARRGAKPILTTHSIYNRPVAGTIPETDHGYVEESQDVSNGNMSYEAGNFESANPGSSSHEPPLKRQRIRKTDDHEVQGLNIAERVKLSRSTSIHYPGQALDNGESIKISPPVPNSPSLRGGPITRKQSGLATYRTQRSNEVPSYTHSSIIPGTMEEADSQLTVASSQATDSQAWDQDVLEED